MSHWCNPVCSVCAVHPVPTFGSICHPCTSQCCRMCGRLRCVCRLLPSIGELTLQTDLNTLQLDAWMRLVCPQLMDIPRWYSLNPWSQRARVATLRRCVDGWHRHKDRGNRERVEQIMVHTLNALVQNLQWSATFMLFVCHCLPGLPARRSS